MSAFFEGRKSDSPYIEMVWRGHAENDYSRTCPADSRWNLLIIKKDDKVKVTVEGPTTRAILFKTFPLAWVMMVAGVQLKDKRRNPGA